MRDMANTNQTPVTRPRRKIRNYKRLRPWVQAVFVIIWLGPAIVQRITSALGTAMPQWLAWVHTRMQSMPGCIFHCYACPLATTVCPIGLIATYSSLHVFPFLAAGVILIVGGLVGSLVCGWACPFGFFQDLAAKIPTRKFRIPAWMGWGRYAVLIIIVLMLPWFFGKAANPLFICRLCPAGAIEASIPAVIQNVLGGAKTVWHMSWYKGVILAAFLIAMLFTYRPWCTVLCPLGALLGLFNRVSVFFLRFDRKSCTKCNLCRSNCPVGLDVEKEVNTSRCIRCMECTTCGAIKPAIGKR